MPPKVSGPGLSVQACSYVRQRMSALVPSASCTRIWLPPGVCMALSKAILITSPLSMTAGEPALVVTRASNDRGGATGVGGLLITTRWPYPNAVAPVVGSITQLDSSTHQLRDRGRDRSPSHFRGLSPTASAG